MPQIIDLAFFIATALIVVAELKRGLGKALLDLVCLYGAFLAASSAAPFLALHAGFAPTPSVNSGWSFGVCFTAFGAVALTASRMLDQIFRWEYGVMDAPLGALVGLVLSVVVLHSAAVMLSFGGDGMLAGSSLGSEALNFKTYHTIVDGFTSLQMRPFSHSEI